MDKIQSARNYVLWLLARRDYSRWQLELKLKARKLDAQEIKTLLEALIADGIFQEQNYKKAKTRQLLRKGMGPYAIKSKLRTQKESVSDADINQAFSDIGSTPDTELKLAIEKIIRKLVRQNQGDIKDKAIQQKIIKTLSSKGHSTANIIKLLKEFN